jgi:hypothetical protein
MKNRLITLAGALALAAVLGKFYAVPAFGQVRAALMQDRDNKARNYYQTTNLSCGYALNLCSTDLPVVPAGKRLVIEHISGEADTSGPNDLYRASLWTKNQSVSAYLEFGPAILTPNNLYARPFNQVVFAAFDAGQTPQLTLQTTGNVAFAWQAVITGYMIDIP